MRPHGIDGKGVDAEHVDGELRQGLIDRGPLDLDHRALGTGHAVALRPRQPPIPVEPYGLRVHHQLAEAPPDRRIVRESARTNQLGKLAERQLDPQRRCHAQPRTLEHQRRQRDVPALARATDHVLIPDEHRVEEHLVELRVARDLAQRTHRHARLAHVTHEIGEVVVPGVVAGTSEQHAPAGAMRERRPHLLAGDAPTSVGALRSRAHRREVTAGVGLAEALAPNLGTGKDRRQEATLLVLGAERDDHGPTHDQTEHVRRRRRACPHQLLVEDGLLHEGGAAPAVFLGPGNARVAGVVQRSLPREAMLEAGLRAVRLWAGMMVAQPRANLVAEGELVGRQGEVHAGGEEAY